MDLPYDDEIVHNAKDRAPSPRPLSADHPDMEEGECEDVDFDASEVVNNNVNTMVGNTVNNNCTTSPRKKRARHESKSNNINNAVGTRPTRQSEGNNNVQLQYQALPVDHAYDPARDGPPLDGAQYLAGVRLESQRMPFVHSVRLPSERRPLSNPADCACPAWEFALTSSSSLDAMDKTTTVHSPAITDEWRRQVVEHFKAMRAYVRGENVDDKIAEQEDDAFPEDFPDMEGELDYGDVDDSAIGPVHDAYSDVNKELGSCSESLLEELVDDVVATSEDNVDVPVKENSVTTTTVQSPMPTLPSLRNRSACFRTFYDPAANAASFDPSSLVSSMKQWQLLKLVEHHCEWFGVDDDDYNDDGGDNDYVDMELGERQYRILYTLLLHLDTLLTGDDVALLRQLGRCLIRCAKEEQEDEDDGEEDPQEHAAFYARPLLVVLADVYGQKDLLDEM